MTFEILHTRLLDTVRQRLKNGDLTERSLGRLTGISQPHIHNVLKGVRILSNNLADEILSQLKINVIDLVENSHAGISPVCHVPLMVGRLGQEMSEFEPGRTLGLVGIPALLAANLSRPVMARLGRDDEARPRFEESDLVLIDQAVRPVHELRMDAVYVVATECGPRLRYLRLAGGRLFLLSESSMHSPTRWETLPTADEPVVNAVKGRVIWVSRAFH